MDSGSAPEGAAAAGGAAHTFACLGSASHVDARLATDITNFNKLNDEQTKALVSSVVSFLQSPQVSPAPSTPGQVQCTTGSPSCARAGARRRRGCRGAGAFTRSASTASKGTLRLAAARLSAPLHPCTTLSSGAGSCARTAGDSARCRAAQCRQGTPRARAPTHGYVSVCCTSLAAQCTRTFPRAGLSAAHAKRVGSAWGVTAASLTEVASAGTFLMNELVDMQWKFIVSASSSEVDRIGSPAVQLSLVLDVGGGTHSTVVVELTLPQFYDFLADMEKAQAYVQTLSASG